MKTRIYLSVKKTNARKHAPVYCRISYSEERADISLGIFVQPKDFCPKTRMIKASCPMAESYNRRIVQSHARIYDIITSLSIQGINTPYLVREIFRNKKKFEIIDLHKTLPSFTAWCEKFIETKYTEKFKTKRNYQNALDHIKKIEIVANTSFTRIDKKTANYIYEYLQNKNLLNYLAKIKFLSKQYHDHFDEEDPIQKFRAPNREKYEKGALTQEELQLLMRHKPKNPLSQVYLDIFLFQYFSAGSRVGDVLRMRWEDLKENTLKRTEEKTGKERSLPVNAIMKAILKKYEGRSKEYVFPLNQPSPSVDNREWCLYKDRIIASLNSCLKTIQKNLKLSTHISSHTSRHTFATHTFEATRDIKTTSLLIGHSKLATTEMYLHADEQLNNDLFAKVYQDQESHYMAVSEPD